MSKPISIAEPVTDLRRVPIQEVGEPLVNFLDACPEIFLDRPRFTYRRETLLREGVATRLCVAAKSLPKNYRLAIVEGWRPPHIQRRMYASAWQRTLDAHPDWSEVRIRRFVNRFTAPMNVKVPPPHSTGGALDVALVNDAKEPYDMMTPFVVRDPHAFPTQAPGLSEDAKRNRQILVEALAAGGITNYPSEFWHYSFGDQGWAYRGGHPHALYGAVTPPDWSPNPADDNDDPLVFIESD